ncbi:hypothetical protein FALBO_17331 [Fusarium albosuccineum]|uniref:Uncharacterized protein n=1 Tax=Fusarium albosuccineum TaxID=1237068 RepID=A0A8H4NMS7_9HYPO|nr:hypothetical protein FALBO_17331 [Fusarium albosuccineum]
MRSPRVKKHTLPDRTPSCNDIQTTEKVQMASLVSALFLAYANVDPAKDLPRCPSPASHQQASATRVAPPSHRHQRHRFSDDARAIWEYKPTARRDLAR